METLASLEKIDEYIYWALFRSGRNNFIDQKYKGIKQKLYSEYQKYSKNHWFSSPPIGCASYKHVGFLSGNDCPICFSRNIILCERFFWCCCRMQFRYWLLLIISSSITDFNSARKVLLGELVLMSCLLIGLVFTMINTFILIDAAQPPTFCIVLIANPFLCTYRLLKGKNCWPN